MVELSKQAKGAIGEHYVVMRLLARGYSVANVNFTVKNTKSVDIFCSNESLNKIIGLQVKTSFDDSKSFNTGLTHGEFMTNGVFDDAKAISALENKVICPWIFVDVQTSSQPPEFKVFVLNREQVIKLVFESEKWYINDVIHANVLKDSGTVALVKKWLEGQDTPAVTTGKRQHKKFTNPYAIGQFIEAWENLGLD